MVKVPLIHIGYHKTASSWLQKVLFKNPLAGFCSPWRPGEYFAQFILANPFVFCASRARAAFEPGFREAREQGLVPVITNEALSGNQYQPQFPRKDVAQMARAPQSAL